MGAHCWKLLLIIVTCCPCVAIWSACRRRDSSPRILPFCRRLSADPPRQALPSVLRTPVQPCSRRRLARPADGAGERRPGCKAQPIPAPAGGPLPGASMLPGLGVLHPQIQVWRPFAAIHARAAAARIVAALPHSACLLRPPQCTLVRSPSHPTRSQGPRAQPPRAAGGCAALPLDERVLAPHPTVRAQGHHLGVAYTYPGERRAAAPAVAGAAMRQRRGARLSCACAMGARPIRTRSAAPSSQAPATRSPRAEPPGPTDHAAPPRAPNPSHRNPHPPPSTQAVLKFVTATAEALGSGPHPSRTYLSFFAVTACELVAAAPQVRALPVGGAAALRVKRPALDETCGNAPA
jgi:hypothetical protein